MSVIDISIQEGDRRRMLRLLSSCYNVAKPQGETEMQGQLGIIDDMAASDLVCVCGQPIRTNNDVEGWHYRLNRTSSQSGLSMYLLLALLANEGALVAIIIKLHRHRAPTLHQSSRHCRLPRTISPIASLRRHVAVDSRLGTHSDSDLFDAKSKLDVMETDTLAELASSFRDPLSPILSPPIRPPEECLRTQLVPLSLCCSPGHTDQNRGSRRRQHPDTCSKVPTQLGVVTDITRPPGARSAAGLPAFPDVQTNPSRAPPASRPTPGIRATQDRYVT